MKTNFILYKETNVIIRRIIKSFFIPIGISLFIVYLRHLSASLFCFLLLLGFVCWILLYMFKSHTVIGSIVFDTNRMIVETNNQTITLPFHTIRRIIFILHGRKRLGYRPSLLQPIGVNMVNGTGNIIEIETESMNYKFDVFLKNSKDENSLEFQIKRLAESGVKVDKRKLPYILGDSI